MNILLTEALLDTKQISNAAIIRIKDGNVRAKSSNFSVRTVFLHSRSLMKNIKSYVTHSTIHNMPDLLKVAFI
jgi:hypothetical protein